MADLRNDMWFSVNLLFEGVHLPDSKQESLWEERIVIFDVIDEADARKAAERLGRTEEHQYRVQGGDEVRWVFRQIACVYEIQSETLTNATEVFSRFLRPSEVKSLLTSFD